MATERQTDKQKDKSLKVTTVRKQAARYKAQNRRQFVWAESIG